METGKRVWLMRFTTDVVIHLSLNSDLDIQMSTCSPKEVAQQSKALGPNSQVFSNNKLIVPKEESADFLGDGRDIPLGMSREVLLAAQLLDRLERFEGEISFQNRVRLLFQQSLFWKRQLELHRPEVVVFSDVPHMYYEWVLIAELKKRGIPVMILADVIGAGHVFLDAELEPLEVPGALPVAPVVSQKVSEAILGELRDADRRLLSEHLKINSVRDVLKSLGAWVLARNVVDENSYYIWNSKEGDAESNGRRDQLRQQLRYKIKAIRQKRLYEKLSAQSVAELNGEPYVYVPLGSGFEPVIHPMASPLYIREWIELLVSSLEEGELLVVREHPMQFRFRHHHRFARSNSFYRWLAENNRVRLISMRVDQFEIIDSAARVAAFSSSSTIIEALARGKPVVHLGKLRWQSNGSQFGKLYSLEGLPSFVSPGSAFPGTPIAASQLARSVGRALTGISKF